MLLPFLCFLVSALANSCSCDFPPQDYVVTPGQAWTTRAGGYFCTNSSVAAGHVVCSCPCCSDGLRNGLETGLDCGGPCSGCAAGSSCLTTADCASGSCDNGFCSSPSLYLLGGQAAGISIATVLKLSVVSGALVVTSNAAPALPEAVGMAGGPHHAGVLNKKLYVAYSTSNMAVFQSWDGHASSWTTQTFANSVVSTGYGSAVVLGSKMYLLASPPGHVFSFDGTSFVEEPNLPGTKQAGFPLVHDSKIWYAGGHDAAAAGWKVASVWSWDGNPAHSWDTSHPSMAVAHSNVGGGPSAFLNGRWYVFGGETSGNSGTNANQIQSWDFNEAGSWLVSSQTLPMWIADASLALPLQGRIYVAGIGAGSCAGCGFAANDAIWSWSGSDSDPVVVETVRLPYVLRFAASALF